MRKCKYDAIAALMNLNFTYEEASKLRLISLNLRRWYERECGDSNDRASWGIERDETTNVPYSVCRPHDSNKVYRTRIPDREMGATKRLDAIINDHAMRNPGAELSYFLQTDCRGAALYIMRPSDHVEGHTVDSYYSRGIVVY
jgi:hypothetical protein